jgi:hypothetical protein
MTLRAENPADNIDPAKMEAIAEDAMQAAFALIAARLEVATGLHVYGDIDPLHQRVIEDTFRGYVRTMTENISVDAEPTTRTLMVATFDVTGLPEREQQQLEMEVAVQAEASDFIGDDGHGFTGHRGVSAPSVHYIVNGDIVSR